MSETRPGRRPRTRPITAATHAASLEEPMSTQTLAEPEVLLGDLDDPSDDGVPTPRARRLPAVSALRPSSPVPTYIGIGITTLGFVLIAVAWGQVAGESNVALQVPYLVSGGLFGLALVLVGLTVVSVAAKRRDAELRGQQTQLLAEALHELRTALHGGEER